MTPKAPPTTRSEFLEGIAEEFLHNASRGRRLIAVEAGTESGVEAPADAGVDARAALDSARFADGLADVLAAHGQSVVRASVGEADEAALRADTIEPFRSGAMAGATADSVLVVDGRHLLDDGVRGIWHFSLWLLAGDELPHSGASVIVDATDAASPSRFFYDYCALPPSVNRPGLR
ncbi:hypothetical protein [Agromyces laixinhei]|uniref:hypothetical protein n=1 Tax=Agromyces laixinhei TaxID=2585717 RepID=UPI001E3A60CC|nr:hypothetical protein [Agromyces laixinhei]